MQTYMHVSTCAHFCTMGDPPGCKALMLVVMGSSPTVWGSSPTVCVCVCVCLYVCVYGAQLSPGLVFF